MSRQFDAFVSEAGELSVDNLKALKGYYKRFAGNEIVITVGLKAETKSQKQVSGFHAMVMPWARDEGHRIEDLKRDLLREIFGERETVSLVTGEVRMELNEPHTSTLNRKQYSELIERTLDIAADCGYVLEAPNEYRERKEREAKAARKRARAA